MRTKILLIEPPYGLLSFDARTFGLFEPLGLETIAAAVPDVELKLLDLRAERDEEGALGDFVPDICAFACHSYATIPSTLRTMARYREKFPNAVSVVGGHTTYMPGLFNRPYVDAVVLGEGEETFRELVGACAGGRDLESVKGLALPNLDGGLRFTGPRTRSRWMGHYAHPRRDLTARYRQHYYRYDWRPMASVVTSRGCPYRCDYCSIWKGYEGRFRVRPAEDIVEEIERIEQPYVTIVDDNTLVDLPRVETLIRLLRRRNIRKTYSIYARTDTVADHPDLVRALAAVGVKRILLGIDGFRDAELADRNKRNSVEKNGRAIQVMHQCGMQALGYFLVRPDYTESDFDGLAGYVREMGIFQPIFTMLTPLPGTDLYEKVKDSLVTQDPRFYDFMHMVMPTTLPLEKFYRCFTRLWRRSHRKSFLKLTPAAIRTYLALRRLYGTHELADPGWMSPCVDVVRPGTEEIAGDTAAALLNAAEGQAPQMELTTPARATANPAS